MTAQRHALRRAHLPLKENVAKYRAEHDSALEKQLLPTPLARARVSSAADHRWQPPPCRAVLRA